MSLREPDLPTRKSKVETNQPKRILYSEVKVTSFQYSASRLRSLKPRTKYCDGEETTSFLDVVLLSLRVTDKGEELA